MGLNDEFRKMVSDLAEKHTLPAVADVFFPPFYEGGQPRDAEFMALGLEGGATGLSFVLVPDERKGDYEALTPAELKPLIMARLMTLDIGSASRDVMTVLSLRNVVAYAMASLTPSSGVMSTLASPTTPSLPNSCEVPRDSQMMLLCTWAPESTVLNG